MSKNLVFFDTEISVTTHKILDIGALKNETSRFHSQSVSDFFVFCSDAAYLCGHNIVHHDLEYLKPFIPEAFSPKYIDTLYLSPLLFPKRPYHALLKDDKLQTSDLNNPVNDSIKASKLFHDEWNAFLLLPNEMQHVFCSLLSPYPEFQGFFDFVECHPCNNNPVKVIRDLLEGKICSNAPLENLVKNYPLELAYAIALIHADDSHSIFPAWIQKNFPSIDEVFRQLRHTLCQEGCDYCRSKLDVKIGLKKYFGYDLFRTYNGEPLQERAAHAAVMNKSLLAVFPTGGGKSITFQLPALLAGETVHGLTVVISPLQSLMKDQVDNLNALGITEAVTINGLLDPIERAKNLSRVKDGDVSLLYISPELLRSRTIESLLQSRNIVRFVIDEAHCFSAWGQDFRVDYLYIAEFIQRLRYSKSKDHVIPVSCFTATAKQKVISDIRDYFKKHLNIELELFTSSAERKNLRYVVLHKETKNEKYEELRELLFAKNCPTIVYVSRTHLAEELANKLTADGFNARPFHGQLSPDVKIANQDAFICNEIQIIVATSAFGMGVDKKDVKLVVHYDISDSLENYVQEAGRAGRDPSLKAECYVLFNDDDLNNHFLMLNQTKISISEIQQVWKAIKDLTRFHPKVCCSPLEIARKAGWDDSVHDIETRIKTAISALENAGYVQRGHNVPRVFATSIMVQNMQDASEIIDHSQIFSAEQRINAKRIIQFLISSRSRSKAGNDDAESRVDYLADMLGIPIADVMNIIQSMRQIHLLENNQDLTAYILKSDKQNKIVSKLEGYLLLEKFMLKAFNATTSSINLKELNEQASKQQILSSVTQIKNLLFFLIIDKDIKKIDQSGSDYVKIQMLLPLETLLGKVKTRRLLCHFILNNLFTKTAVLNFEELREIPVEFSLVGLYEDFQKENAVLPISAQISLQDISDSLLYLSKIGILKIEGGFLVLYNRLELKRLILDNKIRFKNDDYRNLDEYYKQRIQQIHIVGEYANLMVRDYNAALQFVSDYFQMDYKKFIAKYFKGEREKQITQTITPAKYHQLFDELSETQFQIIQDQDSQYIVVAAGPGSGKTRLLVHKLASLLLLEDVKHDSLLMLTFSRAAASEFKQRLLDLIGNAANFLDIKTFHSYCFDLLGKPGNLTEADNIIKDATQMILNGEVEPSKITKSVLVLDEAQDMDESNYNLVKALMAANPDMRVIAVGDDDQNIFEFRGSSSKYMQAFITDFNAKKYEMCDNYRSASSIVALANAFVLNLPNRMKSTSIRSINNEPGTVQIIRHTTKYMEVALIEHLMHTYHGESACVLTTTNEKAMQVQTLLSQKHIKSKLIQNNENIKVKDLAEVRHFLKYIQEKNDTPVIDDVIWNDAKEKVLTMYADSNILDVVKNLFRTFETTYYEKYLSSFLEFLKESNIEDFYGNEQKTVFVSTIHKAKGREFDSVYILLDQNNMDVNSDENKRKLYVGLTRAKSNLFIHCDFNLFDTNNIPGVQKFIDTTIYDKPDCIDEHLSHKHVYLDYFKDKKQDIFKLHSGKKLSLVQVIEKGVKQYYLQTNLNGQIINVAKIASRYRERIEKFALKGYFCHEAEVHCVVAWKGENDTTETAVLLPILHFVHK